MLKARHDEFIAEAQRALSENFERVPFPGGDFADDLIRCAIHLSAFLSSDGADFLVHVYAGGANAADAYAEVRPDGASIWICNVPANIVNAGAAERYVGVLMIACAAYQDAMEKTGQKVVIDTDEPAHKALARAAVAQPVGALQVAARRLCH